jgi:hypothetical protein
MTDALRSLLLGAAGLLMAGTAVGAWVGGSAFGGGVAAAGALVLVNFLLWVRVGRGLFAAALGGQAPVGSALLYSGKLLLLVGGLWALIHLFPPAAVLLGASVLVVAFFGYATASTFAALGVGEA